MLLIINIIILFFITNILILLMVYKDLKFYFELIVKYVSWVIGLGSRAPVMDYKCSRACLMDYNRLYI